MDMTKFLSILQKEALFFCRADKFNDEFEGSVTAATIEARRKFSASIPGNNGQNLCEQLEQLSRARRKHVLVNCWHVNEHESAATGPRNSQA
jgi:hypothetical protein